MIKCKLTLFLFAPSEYSVATHNWGLIDVAHNNTRGSSQRLREKMEKIKQANPKANHYSKNAACKKLNKDRLREAQRVSQEAEQRAKKADMRNQELIAENVRLQRDLERTVQRANSLETQWKLQRSEIELTEKVLGGRQWGMIKVAKFRGVKVAAKILSYIYENKLRDSDHLKKLCNHELNMAARLRHPNLVQFIGATLEGEMIILTELMHTSLRRVLEPSLVSTLSPSLYRCVKLSTTSTACSHTL